MPSEIDPVLQNFYRPPSFTLIRDASTKMILQKPFKQYHFIRSIVFIKYEEKIIVILNYSRIMIVFVNDVLLNALINNYIIYIFYKNSFIKQYLVLEINYYRIKKNI